MSVPAHLLRASLDEALEVIALTDTAKGLGAGALADVMTLPEPHRTRLLDVLRQCWRLNAEIMAASQRLSRTLDELARVAHHSRGAASVKALAAELRPHLTVIADPLGEVAKYVAAVEVVCDLIDATPFDRLAGGGMRRALGPGRHALLMSFVQGHAEPLLLAQHAISDKTPTPGRAGGEATGIAIPLEAGGLATTLKAAA